MSSFSSPNSSSSNSSSSNSSSSKPKSFPSVNQIVISPNNRVDSSKKPPHSAKTPLDSKTPLHSSQKPPTSMKNPLTSSKKSLTASKKSDKVRRKINFNFGPFHPRGLKITEGKKVVEDRKGKQVVEDPKGKQVVVISSDSDSSDSTWSPPQAPSPDIPTPIHSSSSSEGGYGLFVSPTINKLDPDYKPENPPLEEQIQTLKMLDEQAKSDSYKRKRGKKVPERKKKGKKRLVKVFVGGGDLTEKGYNMLMTGELRFQKLYENYGKWQNYSPFNFDLWYGGKMLHLHECPDDVDLPHQARVVARGRYSWMNMDSRVVVVQLNQIVNTPHPLRLTLQKDELMTSVYDRVANISGITLSSLRLGVEGDIIDTEGQVKDKSIKNEDLMWWMNYSHNLKFW